MPAGLLLAASLAAAPAADSGRPGGAAGGAGVAVPWATVDAGATVRSAQGYRLSTTVGQPDALTVAMTGGPWLLRGGFWLTPAEGGDLIFADGFQ